MLNSTLKDVIKKSKDIPFDLNKDFIKFKQKLNVFIDLKVGEKIGKKNNDLNNKYWIYKESNYQKIQRWWYNENRYITIVQLDFDFGNFFKFLDAFSHKYENECFGDYLFLKNNIHNFIDDIILGLYNLKKTYNDFKEMELKIDSIILTLLDFKELTNDISVKKNSKKTNENNIGTYMAIGGQYGSSYDI